MLYRKLKSKLVGTIGRLSVANLMLAGVAAMAFMVPSPRPAYADMITLLHRAPKSHILSTEKNLRVLGIPCDKYLF